MDHVLLKLSWSLELSASDMHVCRRRVCAWVWMCVWGHWYAFGAASSLLPVDRPPAESHTATGARRKRSRRKRVFLSFLFLFIFFDFSLDISVTLFLKLRNTLLEVWVEGNGRQRGWRQDTDLNCDDSLGFLPLTSSTLLRGGETVATERNLKDGRGFRHCHKHGLPRGMKVNEKALSEPCSSFTHP